MVGVVATSDKKTAHNSSLWKKSYKSLNLDISTHFSKFQVFQQRYRPHKNRDTHCISYKDVWMNVRYYAEHENKFRTCGI